MSSSALFRKRVIAHRVNQIATSYPWLLYAVGVIWILLFPVDQLQKFAFVDENALLPGQAARYFDRDHAVRAESLRDALRALDVDGASSLKRARFLESTMRSMGLNAQVQSFRVDGNLTDAAAAEVRWNSYGVVRTARSLGTESVLLSAPRLCLTGQDNSDGIGALLAVASFVTKFSHWSKDIIFLFPEDGVVGTHAWLEAYHDLPQIPNVGVNFDDISVRGGVITEGVNIELPGSGRYERINFLVEGLNGQLPNADMISTLSFIAQQLGISVSLHNKPRNDNGYWTKFETIFRYMRNQALGFPIAPHALFLKYKIEALTVLGVPGPTGQEGNLDIQLFGEYCESVIRSFSNLLERLHHSFWFYLLAAVWTTIPIVFYIAPVILLSSSLLLQSQALWWKAGADIPPSPQKSVEIEGTEYVARPSNVSSFTRVRRPILLAVLAIFFCYASTLSFFFVLTTMPQLLPELPFVQGLMAAAAGSLVVPVIIYPIVQLFVPNGGRNAVSWTILKCFLCVLLGMTLLSVSVLNPSLSVFAALPSVPIFLLVRPSSSFVFKALKAVAVVLFTSPPGLLGLILTFTDLKVVENLVSEALVARRLFGSWLATYVVTLYWPLVLAAVGYVLFGIEEVHVAEIGSKDTTQDAKDKKKITRENIEKKMTSKETLKQ